VRKHPVESLCDGAPTQLVAMKACLVLVVEDLHEAVSFGGKLHFKNFLPAADKGDSSARRLVNGVCYHR
jgi:hypothetical protein